MNAIQRRDSDVSVGLMPGTGILLAIMAVFLTILHLDDGTPLIPYSSYARLTAQIATFSLVLFSFYRENRPAIHDQIRNRALTWDSLWQSPLIMGWAAFFAWSLLSATWSDHSWLVIQRSLLIFVPSFFLLIMLRIDKNPADTLMKLMKWLAGLGFLLVCIGLVEEWLGPAASFGKMTSLTRNQNTLASVLLLALPSTYALYHARSIRGWTAAILCAVQFVGLILTTSRAGIGMTLVAMGLIHILSAQTFRQRILRIGISTFFITLTVLAVKQWSVPIGMGHLTTSLNGRGPIWEALWGSIVQTPLIGVGFGVSTEAIIVPAGIEDLAAHNIHLAILSEAGVLGLMITSGIWLGAAAWALYHILKRQPMDATNRIALITAASLLVSLFGHQMFESQVLRYATLHFFWIFLVGFVAECRRRWKGERQHVSLGADDAHA